MLGCHQGVVHHGTGCLLCVYLNEGLFFSLSGSGGWWPSQREVPGKWRHPQWHHWEVPDANHSGRLACTSVIIFALLVVISICCRGWVAVAQIKGPPVMQPEKSLSNLCFVPIALCGTMPSIAQRRDCRRGSGGPSLIHSTLNAIGYMYFLCDLKNNFKYYNYCTYTLITSYLKGCFFILCYRNCQFLVLKLIFIYLNYIIRNLVLLFFF